jgi:hypothetical protein
MDSRALRVASRHGLGEPRDVLGNHLNAQMKTIIESLEMCLQAVFE